ncbi:MAG: ArsR/SmtB family transcription factor [Acidimicrobiales bacterium]
MVDDTVGIDGATEFFRALASPHRVGIVAQLARGPRCVHELAAHLTVSQPLVSQHLRVLRASGLVRAQRSGKLVSYSLSDPRVGQIVLDTVGRAAARTRGGDQATATATATAS